MRTRAAIFFAIILAATFMAAPYVAAAEVAGPPRHDFPAVGGYQVLTGDFHSHTIRSDGKVTTAERLREAWQFGYDVIAITDHRTIPDDQMAERVADALGLVFIRGLETGMRNNEHILALGVSKGYEPRDSHSWAEEEGQEQVFYQDEMRAVAAAGGILVYAHPHVGFRECVQWGIEQGIIVGIEVKNGVVGAGWGTVKSHGTDCYPFAFDWALEHNLALFANSDIHATRSGDQPVTLLFVKERSPEGVMEAIRGRRTVAWFNGMLWGRQDLLSDLVNAVVSVRRSDRRGELIMKNAGPVPLKAVIGVAGDQPVDLPAYEETRVPWSGSSRRLGVRWDNIWTTPLDNLQSELSIARASSAR